MSNLLAFLAQRKKAVMGFLAPGVGLFAADWAQHQTLPTTHQWEAIAVACVLTGFGVHQVANAGTPVQGD